MANPFLVLGGIAVGIVTAAFGVLQVPGWVASAQDASAKNDVAQVSILEAASLSQTGFAYTGDLDAVPASLGVDVTTQADAIILPGTLDSEGRTKNYAVVVESESGKTFVRVDGGEIHEIADGGTVPTTYAEAAALDA